MNINDPGKTYGRGGKLVASTAPVCDVNMGNGGDYAYMNPGAGSAGGVIIYAYVKEVSA